MDDLKKGFILIIVSGVTCGFFSFSSYSWGEQKIKKEAISNGHAYYSVDPQTGDTEFTWGHAGEDE